MIMMGFALDDYTLMLIVGSLIGTALAGPPAAVVCSLSAVVRTL